MLDQAEVRAPRHWTLPPHGGWQRPVIRLQLTFDAISDIKHRRFSVGGLTPRGVDTHRQTGTRLHAHMVRVYALNGNSLAHAERLYAEMYPNRNTPAGRTFF
ncbi:hypothetical protein EVAR_48165_1 [Eumeta japonica]|uniref:Uncharacterized protein n=1 Tax=Eumeta variegata TaxID=151549 RepID=A0A4C1WR00_EUMVA|nr:hypothetical protein EVAR_48165_1 [Eumeta japonica]